MAGRKKSQEGIGPLLDLPEEWEGHWKGMPEFKSGDLTPCRTIYVHFASKEDVKRFAQLMGQNITKETKFLWFPKQEEKRCTVEKEWVNGGKP